jgi:hypothetical protein
MLCFKLRSQDFKYEGRPESKDRLRIALAQVNEFHHFKVNGPQ